MSAERWECGPHSNAWNGHDARCRKVPAESATRTDFNDEQSSSGEPDAGDDHWTCGGCGHEGNGPDSVEWYEHTKACAGRTSAQPDDGDVEPRMTDAEQRDIRAAFERDRWAGEWNSLPTAIDRMLAARDAEVRRATGEQIAQAIEAERPEMGLHINVTDYRRGMDDGLIKAARIAREVTR